MKASLKSKKKRKREDERRTEPAAEANVENASPQQEAQVVPGRLAISPETFERLNADAEYQQHPYGKVWQRFDLDALAELAGNIDRRGLDQEILLYQGMVLEGWHRYLACLATETTPTFAEFQGGDLEAAERVHASGIRRQSTPEQRYASFMLLCDACPEFKSKYEELKEKGIQQQQAGQPLSTDGLRVDVLGAKAAAAGVSRSTAAKVEKVKKEEPGAVADIASGKTSANKVLKKTKKGKFTEPSGSPSEEATGDDTAGADEGATGDTASWERAVSKAEADAAKVDGGERPEKTPAHYTVTVMVFSDSDQTAIYQALSNWSPIRKTSAGTKQARSVSAHVQPSGIGALLHQLGEALDRSQPQKVRVNIEL